MESSAMIRPGPWIFASCSRALSKFSLPLSVICAIAARRFSCICCAYSSFASAADSSDIGTLDFRELFPRLIEIFVATVRHLRHRCAALFLHLLRVFLFRLPCLLGRLRRWRIFVEETAGRSEE